MAKIKARVKPKVKSMKSKKPIKKKLKPSGPVIEEPSAEDNTGNESDSSSEDESDAIVNYKKTLESLKDNDSEFYEFLKQNDKQLLDFDVSDEEVDENDLDIDSEEISKEKLSVNQIDEWSERLKEKSDIDTIKSVVRSFRKAVEQTSGQTEGPLIDSDVFNGIINVCLIDLLPAIHKLLKLPQIGSNEWSTDVRAIDPTKSRNWKKMISVMKTYLTNVIKIVAVVTDDSLKASLLRHLLHLVPYIIRYPHLIKRVLKQAILLWSESNETNRILAFICILRLIRTQEQSMISFILKKLYLSYVKNSKFTKEENLAIVNFMKLSLVELYSLDLFVAYQHSFVFIRQLAINLRTAMTLKKKESYKTVYNWQFLHSIQLWAQLLCSQNNVEELKPLICPLVNVIIGTIRLMPSPKLFPMRFHLVQVLIKLSEEANTFIPVLPLITEVLDHVEVTKKSADSKPVDLDLAVKVSQMKTSEAEFKTAVVNKVYDLILQYLSTQSHRISFPELVFITNIKIKKFLKKSHSSQTAQSLKQLVDKIEENSNFINEKRKAVEFGVNDSVAITSWERQIRLDGTPLTSFYNQRKRLQSDASNKMQPLLESIKQETTLETKQETIAGTKRKTTDGDSSRNKKRKRNKRSKGKERRGRDSRPSMSGVLDVNQTLDMSSDDSD